MSHANARLPAWDFSHSTLAIVEEFGFGWDSSLMGRDFSPYRPRNVVVHREHPNEFGPPSPVLELPVSWHLDDPALDHVPGVLAGVIPTDGVLAHWRDTFDYARNNEPGGVVILTVHGIVSGRAHAITVLERLVRHMTQHDDVWFATLSDIHDRWHDESPGGPAALPLGAEP